MRISVVTVCYNAAGTIADTIASVAGQDWPDFEHIVVDGGSSDGTLAIIDGLKHGRMHIVTGPDAGPYDAMNKGLARATGDLIGYLNADDFFASPQSLRMIAGAALRSKADCVMGDTMFVDGDGNWSGRLYSARRFTKWWLKIGVMPPHPSFYARTQALRAIGGFDTRYRIAADFDLIARLILSSNASWTTTGTIVSCFRLGGVSTVNARAKMTISNEMADSLTRLGIPAAKLAVTLRYPLKLLQYGAGLKQKGQRTKTR